MTSYLLWDGSLRVAYLLSDDILSPVRYEVILYEVHKVLPWPCCL